VSRGADIDVEALRARVRLSDVVGRSVTWDRRKSTPARGVFWACCPFHSERSASFKVDDNKGFYYCFGCQVSGDAITWLARIEGLGFLEACAALGGEDLPAISPEARAKSEAKRRRRDAEAEASAARGLEGARQIWAMSEPDHPLLAQYLEARGVLIEPLRVEAGGVISAALRVHPDLPHYNAAGRVIYRGPAMVGRIAADGPAVGVHRTWITARGRAEIGGEKLTKKWLGRSGSMDGTPIRFAAPSERLIVGEGIETVLAVWSRKLFAYQEGRGPYWSAEAALSLGSLTGRADPRGRGPRSASTGRELPSGEPDWNAPRWLADDCVGELVILGEGSLKDAEAAERHALCARRRHERRRDGSRRECRTALPGGDWSLGLDFADVAREG